MKNYQFCEWCFSDLCATCPKAEIYQQGRADREHELGRAFKYLFGGEYTWEEVVERANKEG